MSKWIPVSEQLPEESGRYITYLKAPYEWEYSKELSWVTELEFDKEQMLWWMHPDFAYNAVVDAVGNDVKVTHWMPLPDPPEGETHE